MKIEDIIGGWFYISNNQDIAYKVLRVQIIDSTIHAELNANNGIRKYEPITNLTRITDATIIHELETEQIYNNGL